MFGVGIRHYSVEYNKLQYQLVLKLYSFNNLLKNVPLKPPIEDQPSSELHYYLINVSKINYNTPLINDNLSKITTTEKLNVSLYNLIISYYSNTLQFNKVNNTINEMIMKSKLKPNINTFNVPLRHSLLDSNYVLSIRYLSGLLRYSIKPNLTTWKVIYDDLTDPKLKLSFFEKFIKNVNQEDVYMVDLQWIDEVVDLKLGELRRSGGRELDVYDWMKSHHIDYRYTKYGRVKWEEELIVRIFDKPYEFETSDVYDLNFNLVKYENDLNINDVRRDTDVNEIIHDLIPDDLSCNSIYEKDIIKYISSITDDDVLTDESITLILKFLTLRVTNSNIVKNFIIKQQLGNKLNQLQLNILIDFYFKFNKFNKVLEYINKLESITTTTYYIIFSNLTDYKLQSIIMNKLIELKIDLKPIEITCFKLKHQEFQSLEKTIDWFTSIKHELNIGKSLKLQNIAFNLLINEGNLQKAWTWLIDNDLSFSKLKLYSFLTYFINNNEIYMIFAILNLFKNVNDLQDISFFYNWTLRKLIRMKYPNKLILNKLRQLSYYGDGDDDGTFILNESNLKLEEIVKLSWNDNQPIFDLYENDEHFIRVAKLIK